MSKRAFDLITAATALLLLGPLLLAIAVWIKVDSPGPVFLREQRVGRAGLLFSVFKFRTTGTARRNRHRGIARGEAHVTPCGQLLKRYRLDKLPQLFNVVQGTMSLVGPRPQAPGSVACYPPQLRALSLALAPGMTDWTGMLDAGDLATLLRAAHPEQASVDGLLSTRLECYEVYLDQRSCWLDLRIIGYALAAIVA
jgi:lipopolysaccharide/colanic/teichoic acid biosynthesis glycosyltransferase